MNRTPGVSASDPADDSVAEYCRTVEAHLCRRNRGHLIRIVGPAFDCVHGWATRGVPIKVALRGLDRYVDRRDGRGPHRRPVRVEFCEADVLDVFDEWRRATGVTSLTPAIAGSPDACAGDEAPVRRHGSLPAHLERVITRLTLLRAGDASTLVNRAPAVAGTIDGILQEAEAIRTAVKGSRGEARAAVIARLAVLDARLIASARHAIDPDITAALDAAADAELAAFRDRMTAEAYARAREAVLVRLVRERCTLPIVAFEG